MHRDRATMWHQEQFKFQIEQCTIQFKNKMINGLHWKDIEWSDRSDTCGFFFEGLREATKSREDSRCPDRDLNPGSLEYNAELLVTRLWSNMLQINTRPTDILAKYLQLFSSSLRIVHESCKNPEKENGSTTEHRNIAKRFEMGIGHVTANIHSPATKL
jgi:hypothetical protein